MVTISKKQFEAAQQADARQGPIATSVRYRRNSRKLEVEYENGVTLSVPISLIEELHMAGDVSPSDLAKVQVWAAGRSIYFPTIDVSVWTPALLRGVFGTKAWAQELARGLGAITSHAKAAASRENGKKGGRPRKAKAPTDPNKSRHAAMPA